MIHLELTHDLRVDTYNFFNQYFDQIDQDDDHDLEHRYPEIIKMYDYLHSLHS